MQENAYSKKNLTQSPSYLDFSSPEDRPRRPARVRLEEGQADSTSIFVDRLTEIESRIKSKAMSNLQVNNLPLGIRKLNDLIEGKLNPEKVSEEERNYNKYTVLDRIGILLDFMDDHNIGKPLGFFAAHFGRFAWVRKLFKIEEYQRAPETQEFYLDLRSQLKTLSLQIKTYERFKEGLSLSENGFCTSSLTQRESSAIHIAIEKILKTLSPNNHLSQFAIKRVISFYESYVNSIRDLGKVEEASFETREKYAIRALNALQTFVSNSQEPFYSDAIYCFLENINTIKLALEKLSKARLSDEGHIYYTRQISNLLFEVENAVKRLESSNLQPDYLGWKQKSLISERNEVPFDIGKKVDDFTQYTLLVYLALAQTNHKEWAPDFLKVLADIFSDKKKFISEYGYADYWSKASGERKFAFLQRAAKFVKCDAKQDYVRTRMEGYDENINDNTCHVAGLKDRIFAIK